MNIHSYRLEAAKLSGGISNSDIYSAALAAARASKPDAKSILDFGSGVGVFLDPLIAAFPEAEIAGADILERSATVPRSAQWYTGDLNDRLPIADGAFDLISAIEVIEHLENPRHVLREIYRMLRPGGIAIMTTPNTGSIRSLLTFVVRGHHANFDDTNYPAHITQVTETDFKRAGTEAGFGAPDFFYTDVGSVPKFLDLKWQRLPIAGEKLKGKLFSDNLGVILQKPI